MALTPEQLKAAVATYKSVAPSTIQAEPGPQTAAEPGFMTSMAKGIASPFLKTGTSIANVLETTANLGAAGISGVFGTKDQTRKLLADAAASIGKRRNFGVLGKIAPVGYSQETGKMSSLGQSAKDIVGTGLELGSYFVGGGGAKNVAKLGFGGLVKKGAAEGLKVGAYTGAAQLGGKEMQSPTSTLGSVLGMTALGGGGGGLFGGAIGGLLGTAAGTGQAAASSFGTARNLGTLAADKFRKTGTFLAGAPERIKQNAAASAAESAALSAEAPAVQSAIKAGIPARDAGMIGRATPEERAVFRAMSDEASTFHSGTGTTDSATTAGSKMQERIGMAEDLREEIGARQGKAVEGLAGGDVSRASSDVVESLRKVRGLEGLSVDAAGKLDFGNTTLSSKMSAGDAQQIQTLFDEIAGRDPLKLHRLRQEIFEILGGKKKSLVPLTDTSEKAFEAIRKGLAETLNAVNPEYGALNKAYAVISEPLRQLARFYRGLEGASDDILSERSGTLMRRLTSNAPSGQQLRMAIGNIDGILEEAGQKSGVSLQALQDFQNVLDDLYGPTNKTGFAGQVKLGVDASAKGLLGKGMDIVNDAVGHTQETKRAAIEALLTDAVPKGSAQRGGPVSAAKPLVKPFMQRAFEERMPTTKALPPGFLSKGQSGQAIPMRGNTVIDMGKQVLPKATQVNSQTSRAFGSRSAATPEDLLGTTKVIDTSAKQTAFEAIEKGQLDLDKYGTPKAPGGRSLADPVEGGVYYHGTIKKNKSSLLKNGFNPSLSKKGFAEQPEAFYIGDYTEASMYGDDMVGVRVKKGEKIKTIGISDKEWGETVGRSRNSVETALGLQELRKRGYDAVNSGKEIEILSPNKFEVFDVKKEKSLYEQVTGKKPAPAPTPETITIYRGQNEPQFSLEPRKGKVHNMDGVSFAKNKETAEMYSLSGHGAYPTVVEGTIPKSKVMTFEEFPSEMRSRFEKELSEMSDDDIVSGELIENLMDEAIPYARSVGKEAVDMEGFTRGLVDEVRVVDSAKSFKLVSKSDRSDLLKPRSLDGLKRPQTKALTESAWKSAEKDAKFYIGDAPTKRGRLDISEIRGTGMKPSETINPNIDLQKPIVVLQTGSGYQLLDGRNRIAQLKKNGIGDVDAIIAYKTQTAGKDIYGDSIANNSSIPTIKIEVVDGEYDHSKLDKFVDDVKGSVLPLTHETDAKGVRGLLNDLESDDIFASVGHREGQYFLKGADAYRILLDVPKSQLLAGKKLRAITGEKYMINLDTMDHGEVPFMGNSGHVTVPFSKTWVTDVLDKDGKSVMSKFVSKGLTGLKKTTGPRSSRK